MISFNKTAASRLPPLPYKGLNSYTPEDAPLFVGREREVVECANLLGQFSTRILILHGATGCGKSSFLQAGLIPVLQDDFIGFQFLRTERGGRAEVLLIRSTDRPLFKLAETLCNMIEQDASAGNPRVLGLSDALPEYAVREELLERLGTDPVLMVQTLRQIAQRLPRTLVVIIDQAEEVLTLSPDAAGDADREHYFRFLQLFSHMRCDLRLILTLRTDFYGRFEDRLQRETRWLYMRDPLEGEETFAGGPGPCGERQIESYLLDMLSHDQLVRVIELPTSKQPVGRYGAPYDHYGFSYEDELPNKIVLDIKHSIQAGRLTGGILPVLQIICYRLYVRTRRAAAGATWKIRYEDYQKLGDVEEQFSAYLWDVLKRACSKYASEVAGAPSSEQEITEEVERWAKTLYRLILSHPDNTVTKQLCYIDELKDIAEQNGCKSDVDWIVDYLSGAEARVLWRTEVVDPETTQVLFCYSLGHDSVAMALQRWQQQQVTVQPEARSVTHVKLELLEEIIREAQKLSRISARGSWLDAAMSVSQHYATKYRVTLDKVYGLAERIYQNSSYRLDDEELQVLAAQPETYFPHVIEKGKNGRPIVRPANLDAAASKIEEEGRESGMVAKTMKARSMQVKG